MVCLDEVQEKPTKANASMNSSDWADPGTEPDRR